MESLNLPALRPSVAVVKSLEALLATRAVEHVRVAAAAYTGDEGDYIGRGHRDTWNRYLETGVYDGVLKTLAQISVGSRTRTNSQDYQSIEDFEAIESPDLRSCTIRFADWSAGVHSLEVEFTPGSCTVRFQNGYNIPDNPVTIDDVEDILTTSARPWEVAPMGEAVEQPFRVFIGHGNDYQWRVLKDALRDHHGFEVEAFEGTPRTGQVIRDVLDGMVRSCSAGVLVLTKADEQKDGTWRGRQNVIHEIGYVQAVLGWARAIIVVEEGVVLPSNLDGTQQIRYDGRIEQAEGQVAAALNQLK